MRVHSNCLAVLSCALLISGCGYRHMSFSEADITPGLFRTLDERRWFDADNAHAYVAVFELYFVEDGSVIDYSLLNQASAQRSGANPYVKPEGDQQILYVFVGNVNNDTAQAVYLPVHYGVVMQGSVARRVCTGFGTPYSGLLHLKDNGVVAFEFTRLLRVKRTKTEHPILKKRDKETDTYTLEPDRSRRQPNIIFGIVPDNTSRSWNDAILSWHIRQVIENNVNRINGPYPLMFRVTDVFSDSMALRFDSTPLLPPPTNP